MNDKVMQYQMMILAAVIFSTPAWAWEVARGEKGYQMVNKGQKIDIPTIGGRPSFKKIESADDYELVIYHAGSAGTSVIIEALYAIVLDKKNAVRGAFPYRYMFAGGAKGKPELEQPEWKYDAKARTLTIKDDTTNTDEKIDLAQPPKSAGAKKGS